MTNLSKSMKLKRPMMVLDASSMLSIKGGKRKEVKVKSTNPSGATPPDM